MWSIVAISLFAFIAHAEENAADPQLAELMKNIDSEEFRDQFADKFINKLFEKGLIENGNSASDSQMESALQGVDENALIGAAQQLTQSELDRAANRGTAYEWIKYNSEVDPVMAFEAQAAVALMNERKARNDPSFGADLFHSEVDASDHSNYHPPQEEELAETSTESMSLASFALMACFAMGLLTLAVRSFQRYTATENKQALLNGYTAF